MAMRKIDKSLLVDPHSEEVTAVPPDFDEIGRDEGLRVLESHTQEEFGISANEFIQRWDNRDFPQDPDSLENWWRVSLLIPFAIQRDYMSERLIREALRAEFDTFAAALSCISMARPVTTKLTHLSVGTNYSISESQLTPWRLRSGKGIVCVPCNLSVRLLMHAIVFRISSNRAISMNFLSMGIIARNSSLFIGITSLLTSRVEVSRTHM